MSLNYILKSHKGVRPTVTIRTSFCDPKKLLTPIVNNMEFWNTIFGLNLYYDPENYYVVENFSW